LSASWWAASRTAGVPAAWARSACCSRWSTAPSLFIKEDLIPTGVYRPLYLIAPVIALGCALISIGVVPFGEPNVGPAGIDLFEIADVNIGLLVILGITSIGVYGIALAGWSSNNKYSLLGSLRSSAQLISYELALGLSLVGVVMRAGSLNLREDRRAAGNARYRPGTSSADASSCLLHLPDGGLR
jgi:NADH:ubiquinone oxidoreductase subunit H